MACCMAEKYGRRCEAEETFEHEGEEYCIFHLPSESPAKSQFKNSFLELLKDNTDRVAIYGVVFPPNFSLSQADDLPEKLSFPFDKAMFEGGAKFSDITFTKQVSFNMSEIKGSLSFNNVRFLSHCDFYKSRLNDTVKFENCIFSDSTDFTRAVFSKRTVFHKTFFHQHSNFVETIFEDNCYFYDVTFENETLFFDTHFNATYLTYCTFSGYTEFNRIKNNHSIEITDTKFENITFFKQINFSNIYINRVSFLGQTKFFKTTHSPSLSSCTVPGGVSFDRCCMTHTFISESPIEEVRYIACQWPKIHGRCSFNEALHPNDRPTALQAPKLEHIADTFRRLKKVARIEQDQLLASDWHYGEKEMLRQSYAVRLEGRSIRSIQWWKDLRMWFALTVYKLISEYGEGPARAGGMLLLFALLPLTCIACSQFAAYSPWDQGWEGFYKIAQEWMNYVPLGTRSPEVAPPGRIWQVLSQILITAQAGLFGFALRNKFRR